MSATESGAAVTRFDFTRGAQRGTHLTLYASCIVHRGEARLETIPLTALSAVGVDFRRDPRAIGWGAALLVLALALFLIAGPLADTAGYAAGEIAAGASGVAAALLGVLRFVEAAARLLPVLATLAALGGIALGVLGWLGETILSLTFAGGERSYAVHGRNAMLLDFAEAVSGKIMQIRRA